MKVVTAALIIGVAVLAWQLNSKKLTIANLQKRLDAVNAKLESRSGAASIELQEKCAKQAREQFRQSGWEKERLASFESHYNEKLAKCFMLTRNTEFAPVTFSTFMILADAFEGKVLGNYSWRSDRANKEYSEIPPIECNVTLPSGLEWRTPRHKAGSSRPSGTLSLAG
jgi:hypothetical protein